MRKVALTIAGSDSGGGAGIQADLKTFHQFGVYGTSAITAITVQNTLGVEQSQTVEPELVRAQIAAVATDLRPHAIKTGMLPIARSVWVVAEAIRQHDLHPYVFDPVMVSSSGMQLGEFEDMQFLITHLMPLADLVTPNLHEASNLTMETVEDVPAMERAARALVDMGAAAALVKGGHLAGPELVDVLFTPELGVKHYRHHRIETTSTHGTGCTLSAAITARLALGDKLEAAVETALAFVHRAIGTAPGLGRGHGPLNHWA
jgi:hydroxymethylpyrimidine/phosphomethylpyrimidine kinase